MIDRCEHGHGLGFFLHGATSGGKGGFLLDFFSASVSASASKYFLSSLHIAMEPWNSPKEEREKERKRKKKIRLGIARYSKHTKPVALTTPPHPQTYMYMGVPFFCVPRACVR